MAAQRKASRYVVPVAVAGIAAATIGLVPALAASGDPDLPEITAQQLIEKIAASDTQTLSGTFKISTDLGLPALDGLLGGIADGMASGGASGAGEGTADPSAQLGKLVAGTHTLKVAADGPERQKLTLLDGKEQYSLVHDGDDVWAYDSRSNTVFHEKGGAGAEEEGGQAAGKELPASPKELADEVLKAAGDTTSITVGGTANVAGRDAYRLVVEPKQQGSTVDSITIAVDAATGTPLKFTLDSTSGGKPVVDAGFTKVDFGRPAASEFDFTVPKGAKVTEGDRLEKELGEGRGDHGKAPEDLEKALGDFGLGGLGGADANGPEIIGEGWTAIAAFDSGAPAPKTEEAPKEFQGFLDSLGDEVSGKFGSGTVFKTKIVNALMTDDGKVYVGAVTPQALVAAADAAVSAK
ncbi:outer membrane lipoprotein carrier protein LolA [Streptomyces roseolus]|uniref:LolA family protein n=1 Tax=Streptomyces roseolus TaxID=67358 RepID=UPI0036DFD2FF